MKYSETQDSRDRSVTIDEAGTIDLFFLKIVYSELGVSKNMGNTSKSSILIGFSIISAIHFGGFTPIFGNIQLTRNIIFLRVSLVSMDTRLRKRPRNERRNWLRSDMAGSWWSKKPTYSANGALGKLKWVV